jgi:indole-3-glycerol phosphate synthase
LLEGLYAGSVADSQERAKLVSTEALEKRVSTLGPTIDLFVAFPKRDAIHVIAEIKRASPSRGVLAEIPDVVALAKDYESSGASCISVLTEERKFLGNLEDLQAVCEAVDVAVLRKDFIATEYQLLEARAAGADLALLIVAGLTKSDISRLFRYTLDLGMTPFVETHNEYEIDVALELGAQMVGINARDLSSFETDRDLFARLASKLPDGIVRVAESAVRSVEDVANYKQAGANAVLVGEALVTGNAKNLLSRFISET